LTEPYPAALEQKVRDFIAALRASVKVRRYAEVYLDHVARDGPEPREFEVDTGSRRSATCGRGFTGF
jgi:hypothetical protein